MECEVCRQLEAELNRLDRDHTEKSNIVEKNWQSITQREHSRLKSTESDARLDLEIARAKLRRHKCEEHGEEYFPGTRI